MGRQESIGRTSGKRENSRKKKGRVASQMWKNVDLKDGLIYKNKLGTSLS